MSIAVAAASPAASADRPIRVMVVDDAVVARSLLRGWIDAEPDMKVVAALRTGRQAVDAIEHHDADVVMLDVDMPELDGISALPLLLKKKRGLVVIMVSTLTRRSAEVSLRALSLGAADYVPKPEAAPDAATSVAFRRELIEKVRTLGRGRSALRALAPAAVPAADPSLRRALRPSGGLPLAAGTSTVNLRPFSLAAPRALLIGSSTGGPQALSALLATLTAAIDRAPVLIAQHMPPTFTAVLAEHLKGAAGRDAHEGEDGEPVLAGGIYVAPGGRHVRVVRGPGGVRIALGDDPPHQFLQAGGGRSVLIGGGSMGRRQPRARAHRHGHRRYPRRRGSCRGGRQRDRSGRGDERGVGHAALGCASRTVFGRTAARSDGRERDALVFWRPPVTPLDYDFLRKSLKERSGLVLSADKQYLAESRLLPVARKAGLGTLSELVAVLKRGNAEALMTAVVEAMMTNESLFFRDKVPFEHFRSTILPALKAARRTSRTMRIWCAAAATGQEPYSLAICLKEMERDIADWRIDILATDLSNEVLGKARAGIYSQFEVQRGLAIHLLIKYFTQSNDMWQLTPNIRGMVKYRQVNLMSDFSHLGMFDLIFCRNVLIYFDQQTKVDLLDRLAQVTAADGYLVLGADRQLHDRS